MTVTIAVSNQKGGVGKTSTALALAAAMAESGRDVLAIDLDPQANLTLGLGLEPENVSPGAFELLLGQCALEEAVHASAYERLSLVPADVVLASAERRLLGEIGFDEILRARLAAATLRPDVVVIDCPPSLGVLATNAITAATLVLVPVQCEFFSARGLHQLGDVVEAVRARRNPALQMRVVPTLFDRRNRICREVLAELQEAYGPSLVRTVIGIDTRMREAQAAGVPITVFSPRSRAARAYRALAAEMLEALAPVRRGPRRRPHAPAPRVRA